ncbi:TRMT10A, partial [Cordylochernes scorpioides]
MEETSSTQKEDGDCQSIIEDENKLSKRQKKKLAKKQYWESIKKERRLKEKEKRKLKKKAALEEGRTLISRKHLKQAKMSTSSCKIRIALDMSFENQMTERELMKAVKQVSRCYSLNRRVTNPVQLYITSYEKQTEKILSINGSKNWDVHLCEKTYMEEFSKEEIVYLTSESENVLNELEPSKIYVIGGLVDHNRLKGLTFNNAIENKINHAKLPLDDNIIMSSRRVLTIDHVFHILLKKTEGETWSNAFLQNTWYSHDNHGVYLTSESENVLNELEPSKIYVIGGLVDHNRLKGLTFNNAIENKINHAKLPLDDNIIMSSRQVLTIDHVFHILLKKTEGETWSNAFLQVIPKRKGIQLKEDGATKTATDYA